MSPTGSLHHGKEQRNGVNAKKYGQGVQSDSRIAAAERAAATPFPHGHLGRRLSWPAPGDHSGRQTGRPHSPNVSSAALLPSAPIPIHLPQRWSRAVQRHGLRLPSRQETLSAPPPLPEYRPWQRPVSIPSISMRSNQSCAGDVRDTRRRRPSVRLIDGSCLTE